MYSGGDRLEVIEISEIRKKRLCCNYRRQFQSRHELVQLTYIVNHDNIHFALVILFF